MRIGMRHITAGIFGSPELAKKLAKAGTTNDIAIYNHASSEGVLTLVHPASDKLQPLLQCVNMIDFPIIVFKELTKEFAEQMVAVDSAGFHSGLIVADGIPEEQIRQAIKGSTLERFSMISSEPANVRQEIMKVQVKHDTNSPVWMPIDNYFDVKGAGTVALVIVRQGRVKKYDVLRVEPAGKEVTIKSMQAQDKDIESAEAGMRLGLSVKGVETSDLKRGYVICKSAKVAKEIKISYSKGRYTKEEIAKGGQLFICAGLQVIAARVEEADGKTARVKLEHPVAYQDKEKVLLGSTKTALPRIIGHGEILHG
jgi:selenocysteine-specific translation elongation factor